MGAGFTSAGAHSCTQGSLGPCMLAWRQGVPQSRCAGVQSAGYLSIQKEKRKPDEAIPGAGMKRMSHDLSHSCSPPTHELPPTPPHLARNGLPGETFLTLQDSLQGPPFTLLCVFLSLHIPLRGVCCFMWWWSFP